MRRVLVVLIGGLALFHLVSGLSNASDVLGGALGWSSGAWRSGNLGFVQAAVEQGHLHLGSPRAWAYVTVIGAAAAELLAGALFATTVVVLLRRPSDVAALRRWMRRGVAVALLVWLGLALGDELFIAYETSGWDLFVLLAILVTVAWSAVELLDLGVGSDRSGDTSGGATP